MRTSYTSLFIKTLISIILIYILDAILGTTMIRIKDLSLKNNPSCQSVITPYVVERMNSDLIIVGSSRASHHYVSSILSDSLDISVYNCGQDGTYFLYQNCILNMMLDRYSPQEVIWDISPECFIEPMKELEYQNIRFLSPYYRSSKWAKEFINGNGDFTQFMMGSNMYAYNSKIHLYILPLLTKGIRTDNGYIPIPYGQYKENKQTTKNAPLSKQDYKLHLLSKTIERCEKQGIDLIFAISPSMEYYTNSFKNGLNEISALAEQHEKNLLNFSDVFASDSTMFNDSQHLNSKGAETFTKMLVNNFPNKLKLEVNK